MLDLNTVKPGTTIYPATQDEAARLSNALGQFDVRPPEITTKTPFQVLVVVKEGVGYKGKAERGVIVKPIAGNLGFPFIWSAKKFNVAG